METRSRLRPIGVVEVVVLGDVNLDLIAHLPRFPNPGQDVLVNSVEVHCGGSAANTAAALSRLGLRARLIGRVGQEPMALMALNCLKGMGVLLGEVQSDPSHTTGMIYIIVTPDGERTMLSDRGANVLTNPDEIRDTPFRQARFFHLSGYALLVEPQRRAALRALDMAREYRLSTSLDPGLMLCETAPGDVLRLLPELDILMPTLAEAQALTGHSSPEACARDLERHCSTALAIKLGQDGCLLAADGGMVRLPAFAIQAQDTTGAGDAFDAGLIAGHLAGLDWVSAALLGNACGAVAASRVGAGDRPPDAGEVGALLAGHLAYPAFAQHHTSIELAMRFLAQGPQGS
jgi:ribokinase